MSCLYLTVAQPSPGPDPSEVQEDEVLGATSPGNRKVRDYYSAGGLWKSQEEQDQKLEQEVKQQEQEEEEEKK